MNRQLTGRQVLFYLVAFFGVVVAVNIYFATVAVDTFRGEDEQKPYQEGIEYNQTLARRAAQDRLGWTATFFVDRLGTGAVRVDVKLRQADGAPETKVALSGQLRHPSDENRDRDIRLVEVKPGEYQADVTGITPGAWDVIVHTPEAEQPFEATRRMWVP